MRDAMLSSESGRAILLRGGFCLEDRQEARREITIRNRSNSESMILCRISLHADRFHAVNGATRHKARNVDRLWQRERPRIARPVNSVQL